MPDTHSADHVVPVRPEIAAQAHVSESRYRGMYEQAARDPDGFWKHEAQRIAWIKAPIRIKNASFAGSVSIKWFEDGVLNASASCLDRHLATHADRTAIIWEGDDPATSKSIIYRELHEQVCRFANGLRSLGVKKGDRVTIYLPMVPEAAVAMLACARIGAIHSVVFGGFSPDSLANRIQDCESEILITADEGRRGGRKVALKANADAALKSCPGVKNVVVVKVTGATVPTIRRTRPRLCHAVRRCLTRLPARADECRRSVVHPLHLRQHRQAEGGAAHHGRLHGVGRLHA